jgi:hypothetical protein
VSEFVVAPACMFCGAEEDVRFQIRVRQQRETMWVVGLDGTPMAVMDPGLFWCCGTCADMWRRKDARTFAETLFMQMMQRIQEDYGSDLEPADRLEIINGAEKEYAAYMQGCIIMELK